MSESQDFVVADPSEQLEAALENKDVPSLEAFVRETSAGEVARAVSRLDDQQQSELMTLLSADTAAFLMEVLSHTQAAGILDDLSAEDAAAILDEMPSDEQADLLGQLEREDAAAIIEQMHPEEASDARLLTSYPPESAGGLMITEYLAFFESMTVTDVLNDIRTNAEQYKEYDVQYVYVIDSAGKLIGVIRLRDLVMTPGHTKIASIMIDAPRYVYATDDLDKLEDFFDANYFYAVPVVDHLSRLIGVVRRASMEEALGDRSDMALLRFGGIIAGEELRTMPVWSRAMRRLAFLTPNIFLDLISASVVAFFEPTIAKVTALAIFLPILSDMSGCSGNQAVAVSIRELSLGLVRAEEIMHTVMKEVAVGIINGVALGALLGLIAYAMRGDQFVWIGLVVGVSLAADTVIAVIIGGAVPQVLKLMKMDPAMASGPILTTITDICGFFMCLSMATMFVK